MWKWSSMFLCILIPVPELTFLRRLFNPWWRWEQDVGKVIILIHSSSRHQMLDSTSLLHRIDFPPEESRVSFMEDWLTGQRKASQQLPNESVPGKHRAWRRMMMRPCRLN